jgi:DNA modification methylase
MKLSTIRPNPKNPRVLRDDKFQKLKKSIEDFPKMMELRPIVVDDEGVILGGNMRFRALQDIYGKNGEIPDAWVKRAADLTEDEKRQFVIKDNAAFGEWDWDMLANEWDAEELADWGIDTPADWGKETKEAEEDDFDADKDVVETVCKKGDIWKLGDHRLMCGDSTSEGDCALLMNGEKADLFITDPPYGVSYGDKNRFLNAVAKGNLIQTQIENDHNSEQEMYDLWKKVFKVAYDITKPVMAYYVFAAQGGELLLLLLLLALKESGLAPKHGLVWVKNNHVLGRADYNYKHEPITYGWKFDGTHHFYGKFDTSVFEDELDIDKLKKDELVKLVKDMLSDKMPTSVIKENKPLRNDLHPTMKPVKLIARLMRNSSQEGEAVLDLFGGSGTTMIAAEQLGRKCYMMELDPHYCDVIIARWEKLTGKKAEKIN